MKMIPLEYSSAKRLEAAMINRTYELGLEHGRGRLDPARVADIDLGLACFTRRWTSVMACPVFASYQRRLIQLSPELVNQ